MPRRSYKSSGVKGPNSALTEFLKNEGITDAFRRRREREATGESVSTENTPGPQSSVEPTSGGSTTREASREVEDDEDEEVVAIKQAAREKRRRAGDVSDDAFSDEGELSGVEDAVAKRYGEPDNCCECGSQFYLSVYSPFINAKGGYLCENCAEIRKQQQRQAKKTQYAARKRRKKLASALLDKRKVTFPTLQDLCIKEISVHINDVDELGNIGTSNMGKICRILSKNRSLNDQTMALFLSSNLTVLEFWDCSNVSSVSLSKIPAFCPRLESLTLSMCGQLHNDNMEYFATNLPHLKKLALNGPFLVSERVWSEYLSKISPLTSFSLGNTHRFNDANLLTLLESTGSQLEELKLHRLDGITQEDSYHSIARFCRQLKKLEISYPHSEDCVTNEAIIDILQATGGNLTELVLDGCTSLGDEILLDGIKLYCKNLTKLSLKGLDLITDYGMADFFKGWSNGGLIEADFTKCITVADDGAYELWRHSGRTLVELSLNSVPMSKDFLLEAFTSNSHPSKTEGYKYSQVSLPLLTKLDLGFVRAVDDEVLKLLEDVAPKLSIVEVYGDNRVTNRAELAPGTLLIGRQLDQDI
ncbi:hypothetical protein DIURU_003507 [Diutina rugosa]|uniref:DNA repair protein RAD7 n=1 Tax=Diutina rugosa TaxID=5481 RepID=A0A642ULB0_DIURU|nr:uncharacterized protein DIURU_003507 [Diutina rugosa]KAA8901137.1 hypothetical protein DIURU_003507 [Diutina rugosa]